MYFFWGGGAEENAQNINLETPKKVRKLALLTQNFPLKTSASHSFKFFSLSRFQRFTNPLSKCKSPRTQSLCPKPITTNYISSSGFGRLSAFSHGQRVITSDLQMSLPPQRFKQIRFSSAARNQAVLPHRKRSLTSGIHIDPTNLPQIILQMPSGGL